MLYDTKEENNFTLKCEIEPNVEYDLDNSLLVDNDKLVIINFQKDAKSTITEDDIIGTAGIRYRSSKKLSKGIIAMIIIVPIVLVAITIGIMLSLIKSRKTERKVIPSESSTDVKNDKWRVLMKLLWLSDFGWKKLINFYLLYYLIIKKNK